MLRFSIFLSFCFSSYLSGALFYKVDTTAVLPCTFSSSFQNRIMFQNGKIEKIITQDEDSLSIMMEELSGQAFISSRDEDLKQTVLSVVLESGSVQDVFVNFSTRLPEIIILEDPVIDQVENEIVSHALGEASIIEKVKKIIVGEIPEGYSPCQVKQLIWKPKRGFQLEPIACFLGENDTLYLYQVQNTSLRRGVLLETEIQCKGSKWVFLENSTLSPKQKTLAVVCVGIDE